MTGGHVRRRDACHFDGFLHGVAAERFAQFLVDHGFDQRGDAVLLVFDGLCQRSSQFSLRAGDNAFQATSLRDACVGHLGV